MITHFSLGEKDEKASLLDGGPLQELVAREQRTIVTQALQRLLPKYRLALETYFHFPGSPSIRQLAVCKGVRPQTIYNWARRAIEQLRKHIGDC